MRTEILLTLIAMACQLSQSNVLAVGVPEGYELYWAEEFEGDSLDTTKWAYRNDAKHRSVQLRENVIVSDGKLTLDLRVLDEPIRRKKAAGAGIISKERFRYGYYEVRARLGLPGDDGRGWHHSFWAMAAEVNEEGNVSTTYPGIRRTEIDCYENATEHKNGKHQDGLSSFTQHVIVWNEKGKEWGRLPKPPTDVEDRGDDFDPAEWHTYGFEWTPKVVRFFVDGDLTKVAEYPAEKHVHDEINLWLTAISANWNSPKQTPSRAQYDYLRCYKVKE